MLAIVSVHSPFLMGCHALSLYRIGMSFGLLYDAPEILFIHLLSKNDTVWTKDHVNQESYYLTKSPPPPKEPTAPVRYPAVNREPFLSCFPT